MMIDINISDASCMYRCCYLNQDIRTVPPCKAVNRCPAARLWHTIIYPTSCPSPWVLDTPIRGHSHPAPYYHLPPPRMQHHQSTASSNLLLSNKQHNTTKHGTKTAYMLVGPMPICKLTATPKVQLFSQRLLHTPNHAQAGPRTFT